MEIKLTCVTPAKAEDVRRLMEHVIVASVKSDVSIHHDMIANVNKNVDYWLINPERCVHIVATLESRIVGVVLVKDFWNLCSLFVDTQFQSRGIGRMLLKAASTACKSKSPKQALFLNAAPNAIGFYEQLGFVSSESGQILPTGFRTLQMAL
ncbi:GNAT family N-acetyltransferase [Collimonas arenae]|uniref:GNAT family N-acetyltransferase n=1 Tax=Collimonas arenae TaxID=279058 RepID=UPI000778427B|nr:GNAT family N-acetyltransferase [Collimonas arenae]